MFTLSFRTSNLNNDNDGYIIECELLLDNIRIIFPEQAANNENFYRQDWFLCKEWNLFFSGSTFRKKSQKRVRVGLDEYDASINNLTGSSSSRDYCVIALSGIEFIVAKVPSGILPDKKHGLCFEFRQNLETIGEDLILGASEFISFLLGNQMHHVGYTIVQGMALRECQIKAVTMSGQNNSAPPIRFNRQKEWGDFTWLLNEFLPSYLELRKVLPLGAMLSRYWISRNTPIGANLPVLASAMEMLVEKYLAANAFLHSNEYMPKNEYLNLVEPILEALKVGLLGEPHYEPIRNKLLNAFRKGPNEKIRHFFHQINLPIGKPGTQAIGLRNKMVHSSRNYSDDTIVKDDIFYTRVYEALFNRVLLKLLGYNGYYIDYSLKGCPLKHIDVPAGNY